ncbi:hypothetical protein DBV15_01245, partial [Temnothorax longispinosus]
METKRTPVAHHYASSRRDYSSYRAVGGKETEKKKGKERVVKGGSEQAREDVVNVEEESSRICLSVAKRKIARFSGATPREKSATTSLNAYGRSGNIVDRRTSTYVKPFARSNFPTGRPPGGYGEGGGDGDGGGGGLYSCARLLRVRFTIV